MGTTCHESKPIELKNNCKVCMALYGTKINKNLWLKCIIPMNIKFIEWVDHGERKQSAVQWNVL